MKALHTLRNYICYCGIERDAYNAVKKDAYVSNFGVWRILHCMMFAIFALLYCSALIVGGRLGENAPFYLGGMLYSALAAVLSFVLKKDSLVGQLLIYLSISLLLLFGALISANNPDSTAATFVALLLITPMFMLDKPYFMAIELCVATVIFSVWMHAVKPYEVWYMDFVNAIAFTVVGILLHIVASSIRIKEFVLTRTINIQKDHDGLTGLKNKDALTREINAYLADPATDKALLFILDVDRFKAVNDNYGHDVGDEVIRQLGAFLGGRFTHGEIVGRFGGDEFIVFVQGTDDRALAGKLAEDIAAGAAQTVSLPDPSERISVSIGVAVYAGQETNYSELFKKADMAMYQAKADPDERVRFYE